MSPSLARKFAPVSAAVLCAAAGPAQADLSISAGATTNVSCSNGVCTATAKKAVLNVGDLTALLGTADLRVATGSGGPDIRVDASFGWSSGSALTLDAARSVTVNRTVKVKGSGGLVVITNDGGINGLFSFGSKGRTAFANLASGLRINGHDYTLVGKISTLAADVAKHPDGSFALADNYDASSDGTYSSPPIPTTFAGNFEGLGNTISSLSIDDAGGTNVGLFAHLGSGGTLADIRLADANVANTSSGAGAPVGMLVGLSEGAIVHATTTGSISGSAQNYPFVGGVAGESTGSIAWSHSTASVTAGASGSVGGLVGVVESGTVYASSATGNVSGGQGSDAGGLAGDNNGQVERCFATGAVSSDVESKTGGLVAYDSGPVSDSYATGAVSQSGELGYTGGFVAFFAPDGTNILTRNYSTGTVAGGNLTGGFIGDDNSSGTNLAFDYWDMTTSGITDPGQGAGFPRNDSGIRGLTSTQLQSRLPRGFHRSTWAQDSAINQGFPYLRANPPMP